MDKAEIKASPAKSSSGIAQIDISRQPWPMSWFDDARRVSLYGRSRGDIDRAVSVYARTLGQEADVLSKRAPEWGRAAFYGGYVLGIAGLALCVAGLLTQLRLSHHELLFGAFGVGLLMAIASGPLVRYGRELLRPSAAEVRAADRRRPVMLLSSFRSADAEIVADAEAEGVLQPTAVEDTVGIAFRRFGPFEALRGAVATARTGTFGEANWQTVDARNMDGAVFVVACPGAGDAQSSEMAAIAQRRHGHKLIVLMPPLNGQWPWDGTIPDANDEELRKRRNGIEAALEWRPKASSSGVWDRTKRRVRSISETEEALRLHRWAAVRDGLKAVPGFASLPEEAPKNVIAVHLTSSGEPVVLTGPKVPAGHDYMRAISLAVYGMKCHGRW